MEVYTHYLAALLFFYLRYLMYSTDDIMWKLFPYLYRAFILCCVDGASRSSINERGRSSSISGASTLTPNSGRNGRCILFPSLLPALIKPETVRAYGGPGTLTWPVINRRFECKRDYMPATIIEGGDPLPPPPPPPALPLPPLSLHPPHPPASFSDAVTVRPV